MTVDVHLLHTRVANIASVRAALQRLDCRVIEAHSADVLRGARRLVLPGVGTPAAALDALERAKLRQALAERLASGDPTLCICLGLQLLAERSDESPDAQLFGLVPAPITRLPKSVRVPQLGWNHVHSDGWLQPGYAYYANSYCLRDEHFEAARARGFEIAWSVLDPRPGRGADDTPVRFCGALRRGALWACQFHPELSGRFGSELISAWLASEPETSPRPASAPC